MANRNDLILIKVHYFLLVGAISGVLPILSVHAMQLSISPLSLGLTYIVIRVLSLVAKPGFGAIGDRFKNHKCLLMAFLFIQMISFTIVCFIPQPYYEPFHCDLESLGFVIFRNSSKAFVWNCTEREDDNVTFIETEKDFKDYFSMNRNFVKVNFTNLTLSDGCGRQSGTFHCTGYCYESICPARESTLSLYLFVPLTIAALISNTVSTTLTDAACYNILQDKLHLFGNQRMFGSLGWMLFCFLSGFLNEFLTEKPHIRWNFSSGFFILIILVLVDLLIVFKLNFKNVQQPKPEFSKVRKLLVNTRILCYLLCVCFNGSFVGLMWSFLHPYIASIGGTPVLLSLISMVQCLIEMPFFKFSGFLIEKIGHLNALSLAAISFSIRFVGYSYLTNPWWTLPLELLQGTGFALFYAATTAYAQVVSPQGTSATMQGLAGAMFDLGIGVGSVLGGYGFNNFDGRSTFYCASLIALASGVAHALVQKTLDFVKKPKFNNKNVVEMK